MQHNRVLWWGNVRGLAFADRLRFARDHGFDALNIAPTDIDGMVSAGETLRSIRRRAEDAGIALTYLDPVVDWLPDWQPEGSAAAMLPFLDRRRGAALDDAAELGIDRVLAITCFPAGRRTPGDIAPHLAAFADRAAERGITVVLEAMPMWGLTHFRDVVELRKRAGRPNVKLLLDTWHYIRGGRDDALVAALPAGVIDHVQIADGTAEAPSGVDLFEDCLHRRLPPGEGALPLTELIALLDRHGHLRSVGPEVFSDVLDGLDADGIAARLMPAFEASLAGTSMERAREGAG